MKYQYILPIAVASAAMVPGDLTGRRQLVLHEDNRHDSLWESLPGRQDIIQSIENMVDRIGESFDNAVDAVARTSRTVVGSLLDEYEPSDRRNDRKGRREGRAGSKDTVYELIRNSKHTKKFARLIEDYDDIRKRLEDDRREFTVFVPTDEAFDKLPEHEKSSKEFVEKILEYHIVPEEYSVGRIMNAHTIPTVLDEKELGHGQRLRVSVGLFGIHLNFYSQIVVSNILGSNGIIHAIDNVLVPPPRQGKLIDALPGKFSTLSLAMEKTGLAEDLKEQHQRGGTVFAPTNLAWSRLGPKLNSFLFSEHGTKFLRVLLKYHVVLNETLYSDAFYPEHRRDRKEKDGDREDDDESRRRHRRDGSEDDDEDTDEEHRRRHRHRDGRSLHFEHPCSGENVPSWCFPTQADDEVTISRGCNPGMSRKECERRRREEERRRRRHHRHGRDGRDEDDDNDDEDNSDDDFEALYSRRHNDNKRHNGHNGHNGNNGHRSRSGSRHGRDRDHSRPTHDTGLIPSTSWRVELPTSLKDRTINVEVSRWMGLVSMTANSQARVSVQDGIARDGVVQVVDSVLMPPRHRRHDEQDDLEDEYEDDMMSVEDFKHRLRHFVDEDDKEDRKHRNDRDDKRRDL